MLTEKWEYYEYVNWEVESLPDGWDDMDVEDKRNWVQDNGEYVNLESEPYAIIEVEDVEVQ
jgi:hypothetical protein